MLQITEAMVVFDWCVILAFRDIQESPDEFKRRTLFDFRSAMDESLKSQPLLVANYISLTKPCAFMFQEASMSTEEDFQKWTDAIEGVGYRIILNENKTTGFFIPNTTFIEPVSVPADETKFSDETCAIIIDDSGDDGCDRKVLLVSSHLNSKSREAAKCPKNYEDQLVSLVNFLSGHQFYVCGADINHHPALDNIIPAKFVATTNKCRTAIQAQEEEIDVVDTECKDHFITNYATDNGQFGVGMISPGYNVRMSTNTSYLHERFHELTQLPNRLHPFDHYLIELVL